MQNSNSERDLMYHLIQCLVWRQHFHNLEASYYTLLFLLKNASRIAGFWKLPKFEYIWLFVFIILFSPCHRKRQWITGDVYSALSPVPPRFLTRWSYFILSDHWSSWPRTVYSDWQQLSKTSAGRRVFPVSAVREPVNWKCPGVEAGTSFIRIRWLSSDLPQGFTKHYPHDF